MGAAKIAAPILFKLVPDLVFTIGGSGQHGGDLGRAIRPVSERSSMFHGVTSPSNRSRPFASNVYSPDSDALRLYKTTFSSVVLRAKTSRPLGN